MKFPRNKMNANYEASLLPGFKEGISGSVLGGVNLGISKYSREEKREEVIKVFKYLTSKQLQKKLVLKHDIVSGIPSVYDDEEICQQINCELYKNVQPVNRPNSLTNDYNKYSYDFRTLVFDFLYGNATASEIVKKIDDITKIYYISYKEDSYILALISYISFTFIISFIFLSSFVLFFKKYKSYFNFLPSDFWFIINMGTILILCSGIMEIGQKKIIKCQLNYIFIIYGFSFIIIPILYKLIVSFPKENKYSKWIVYHKYLFLFIFLIIDIIHSFFLLSSYSIKQIILKDKENFEICEMKNDFFTTLVMISLLLIKGITLLIILILIYVEWNLKSSFHDLRFIVLGIYSDILFLISIVVIKNISIDNYLIYYILTISIKTITSVFNYFILFFVRIIALLMKKETDESLYIKNINKIFIEYDGNSNKERTRITNSSITTNYTSYVNNICNTNSNYDRRITSINSSSIYSENNTDNSTDNNIDNNTSNNTSINKSINIWSTSLIRIIYEYHNVHEKIEEPERDSDIDSII